MGCLDPKSLEALDELRANLEQYRRDRLTDKNLALVRKVLTKEVWSEVVNLPAALMTKARALQDHAPTKAAVTAQIAVATAILTVALARIGNLASIRLNENLIRPGGIESSYWLVFPLDDVKNRVDLNFKLSSELSDMLDDTFEIFVRAG
jgi:hypothetical protein